VKNLYGNTGKKETLVKETQHEYSCHPKI